MKVSPKRKVQAQRKFAQGAYIPPNAAGAAPARCDPQTTNPARDNRNVIHNSLSPTHLLDLVSFQKVHNHDIMSVPIVLLERLVPPANQNGVNLSNNSEPPAPTHTLANGGSHSPKVKTPNKNITPMSLRPKHKSCVINKYTTRKTIKQIPKKLAKIKKVQLRLKRARETVTSDDDEKPLQYFKKTKIMPHSEGPEENQRVLRPTTSKLDQNHETPGTAEPQRVLRPTTTKCDQITETPGVSSSAINPQPKLGDPAQTFKEPAVPSRSRRAAAQENNTQNTAKEVKPVKKTGAREKVTPLYGCTGIERWLTEQSNDKRTTKAPERENRVEDRRTSENIRNNRANSPCPSESLKTVGDVMRAPRDVMLMRCQHCNHCNRVNMVESIADLMQRQRNHNSNGDVYEFSDRDESADPPTAYCHRRRGSQQRSSSDEEEQHAYLDLSQDSRQIIKLTTYKVPNSKKLIMKGHLVNKSDAQKTDDFSLVEHENLLGQLLQSLENNMKAKEDTNMQRASNLQTCNPGPSKRSAPATGMMTRARNEETLRDSKPSTSRGKGAAKSGHELEGKLLEAPVYYPTEQEFTDPIAYYEKIAPSASKFGICKVVAPASFKPRCELNDNIKFNVVNEYIPRVYSRWGPSAREMSAIKAYLYSQNINFQRVPLMNGLEVNLAKLYAAVQRNGGLKEVIEKKRWARVSDEMGFAKTLNSEKNDVKLDSYYVKYLLPYDTATKQERQEAVAAVDRIWDKKHKKLIAWSRNPLHHQKKLMGESDSSEEDEEVENRAHVQAMSEAEDCIVAGRQMQLASFKKVAQNAMSMYLDVENPTPEQVEEAYWKLVLFGLEHVCVNAASIDTSDGGYGFSKNKSDPTHKHPWNLKNFSSNDGNVLSSLGAVLGVTMPTLHLGMVFSTYCWHRDPHGLPFIEYVHEGAPKIWYGIPDEQSTNFRNAVDALCPTSCQNKEIWLSSDITVIPPNLLREHKVTLSRTVQKPGEYIFIFPKSFSCSIAAGYTVSESVYFATKSWLPNVHLEFQKLRSSCEPTTFSLEHLLLNLAQDARMSTGVLQQVLSELTIVVGDELADRRALLNMGIKQQLKQRLARASHSGETTECAICRATLFLSKVTGLLGKKKDLCLAHALRLLQKKPSYSPEELQSIEMIIFKSESQLEKALKRLRKTILK